MKMPAWAAKVAATALIGSLVAGALGWAGGWTSNVSKEAARQGKEIVVLLEQQKQTKESIGEIKSSQLRMEQKLDRALERRR